MTSMHSLQFGPIEDKPNLVSDSVFDLAKSLTKNRRPFVAEIDPQFMGGKELCEHYGLNPSEGANCVIVEIIKPESASFAAIVVPVGYRADLNNLVKKHFSAKRISLAPLEKVLEATKMEYGSITPFGLPESWKILIDNLLTNKEKIIVGGGRQISKLLLPVSTLLSLPNAEVIENLSKPIGL